MAPTKPLAGRNAIVTGAARGIGLAIAQRLAREGAVVVMADLDKAVVAAEALRIAGLAAVRKSAVSRAMSARADDKHRGFGVGSDGEDDDDCAVGGR